MAMAGGDAANQCQCEIHVNWAKWYKGFMHQVFLHTKMEMKKVLDRKKTSEVREPDGELSITVLVSQTNSRIQFTMDLTEEAKELKKSNIKDLQELKKRIVQVVKYRIRAFHYQDFYDVAPMLVPKIMAEGKGGSLESVVDFANFNFGNIPGTKVAIMQRPVAEGKITALKKALFDKWGLTGKLAFLLASYNMYRLWTKGEKQFGLHELFETVKDGVYKVKLGEKDKSLAAATLFTMAKFMEDLDVDGDLVIVIPVPSVLLVTGSRNYDGLCYMGEHVLSLARNKDLITRKPIRIAHAGEGKAHGPVYSSYRPLLPNGEGSVPENAEQLKILTDGLSRRARATRLAAASTSESASARETPVPQACEGDSKKNLPPPPPSSPCRTDKTTQETITAVRLENVRKELDGIRRENTASPIPTEKQRRPVTENNTKANTDLPETQEVTQKQTQDVTQKQTRDVTQKQTQDVTQKQTVQQETQKQTQEVPQKQTQDVTQKQTQDVTQKQTQDVTQKQTQDVTQKQTQDVTQKQTQETQKQTQDVTQKQTQDVTQKQTQDVTQKQIVQGTQKLTQDGTQKQTQDVTQKQIVQQETQKQTQDVTQKQTQDVTQKQTQDVTQKQTQDVTQKQTQIVTQKQTQDVTQKQTQDVTQKQTVQETQKQTQVVTQKQTYEVQTIKEKADALTAVPIATKTQITTKPETSVTSSVNDALVPPTKAPPGGPNKVGVTQPQQKQDGGGTAVKQGKGQGDVIAICQPPTKTTPPPVSTTSKADESRVSTTSGPNGSTPSNVIVATTVIYSKCCSLRLPVTVSVTNTRLLPDTKATSQVATTATPSKTSTSDISVDHEKTPPSATQAPGAVTSKQAAQPSHGTVKPAEEQMPGPKQTKAPAPTELLSMPAKQILTTQLSLKPALEHVQANAVVGKQDHLENTTKRLVGSRVDATCLKESSAMQKQLPSPKNVPVASSVTLPGVTESASLKLQHTDGKVITNSLMTSSAEEKVDQKLVPVPRQQPDVDKPVSVGQLKPDSSKTTTCSKLNDTTVASTTASQVKSAPVKTEAVSQSPEKIAPSTKLQTASVKPAVSTDVNRVTSPQVQTTVPEKAAVCTQVQSAAVKPLTTSSQVQQAAVKSAVSAQMQSTAVSSTAPFQMQEAAAKSPGASQAESTSGKSQIFPQKQPACLKMAANLQIPPAAAVAAKPLSVQPSSAPTPTVSQSGAPKQLPPLHVQTNVPKPDTTSQVQPTVTKPVTPAAKQAALDSSTASTNKNPIVLMTPATSSTIQTPAVKQITHAISLDPKTVASKTMPSSVSEQRAREQELFATSCPATILHTVRPPVQTQTTALKQEASPCLQSTVPKSLSSSVQSSCPTTRTSLQVKTTVVPSVDYMPLKYSKAPQTQLVTTTSVTETDDAAHKQVTSAQMPSIVPKSATKSQPESYKMAASIPLQETALKQTVKKVSPPALPSKPSISFVGKDAPKLVESSEVKVPNDVQLPKQNLANQQAGTTLPHTTKQPIGDAVSPGSQSQRQDADVMAKSSDTVTSPGKKLSVRMVPYVAPPPRGLQGPTIEMLATSEKQQQSVVPKPAATSDVPIESSSFGDKKPAAKPPSSSTSAEAERKSTIPTKTASPADYSLKPANEATVSSKVVSTPEASPKTSAPPAVPKPTATAVLAPQESLGQKVKAEMEASNSVVSTEPKNVPSSEKPEVTNALSPETGRNALSVKMVPYKPLKMAPYTPPSQNSTSQSAPPCDNLERDKKSQSPTEEVKEATQQQPIQKKSSPKSDHDLAKNETVVNTKILIPPDVKREKNESLNPNAMAFNSKTTVDTASVVTTKPSVVASVTENRVSTAQEVPESTTPQIQHQGQQNTQQRPLAVYHGTANSNGLACTEVVRPKEQTQAGNRQMPYRNTSQYQSPHDVSTNGNHGEQQQVHQPTWDRDNYPDAARPQDDSSTQRTTGQTTKGKLASAFKPLADKFQQFKRWRKNKNQEREEPNGTESYNLEYQIQEGMGDALSNIGHWNDFDGNAQYHGQVNGYGVPPADQPGTAQDWTYEQRQWYQEQARLRDVNREMYGVMDPNVSARMSGQAYSGQGWNDNSHYGQRNVVNPVIKTKTTRQEVPQQQQWSQGVPPSDYQRYSNPGAANQQAQSGYSASVDGNPFNKATWRNYRGRNASEPNRSHTQNTQRYDRMSQNSNQDMSARDAQTNNNARSGEPGVRRSASFSRSGPRARGRTPKGSSAVYGEPAVQQPEMQTWIGGGRVTNLPQGTAPPTPPRYYRNRANSHSYSQSRPYQTQTKPIEETKPPTKPTAKKSKPTPQPERGRKNTLTKGAHSRQAMDTVPQSTNYEKPTQKLDTSTRPKTPNPKSDPPSQEITTKPEQIESEKTEEVVDEEEARKALKARRRLLTRKPSDAQKNRPAKIPRIPVFLGAIEAGVREEAWNRALVTAEEDPLVGTSLCVQLCFYCGVVGSWNEDVVLKKCSRCGTASYCSRKCQWNHWNHHKSKCRNLTTDHQKFKVIIQL